MSMNNASDFVRPLLLLTMLGCGSTMDVESTLSSDVFSEHMSDDVVHSVLSFAERDVILVGDEVLARFDAIEWEQEPIEEDWERVLTSALLDESSVLLSTSQGLFVWTDDAFVQSPLSELFARPVRQVVVSQQVDDLFWMTDRQSLLQFDSGQVSELDLSDAGPTGQNLRLLDGGVNEDGQQALWLTQAGEMWRLLRSVDHFSPKRMRVGAAVDDSVPRKAGGVWVSSDGRLVSVDNEGQQQRYEFPAPVQRLFGHVGSGVFWIETETALWWSDGLEFGRIDEGPQGEVVTVDDQGRLYAAGESGLTRLSVHRPLVLLGLAEGDAIEVATTVVLLPTDRQAVGEVLVELDGEPIEVTQDPYSVLVDGLTMEQGAHNLWAEVTYGDDEVSASRFDFVVGSLESRTWRDDVQPLFADRCSLCHSSGGATGATRLGTKEQWEENIELILYMVSEAQMPLGSDALTPEEVGMIRSWKLGGFE